MPEPQSKQPWESDAIASHAPESSHQIDFVDDPPQGDTIHFVEDGPPPKKPSVWKALWDQMLGGQLGGTAQLVTGGAVAMRGVQHQITKNEGPQQEAHGIIDSLQAGYQGSATGLLVRGKLPNVVLDAHHATTIEKLSASAGQMVSELPEMIAGGLGAGALALPSGPGALVVGGAATFAVPTALRESLIQAYSKGEVVSVGDFLSRAKIVLKATGKDAAVGGLTAGAGAYTGKVLAPLAEGAVTAGKIGTGTARVLTGVGVAGAELGTMTVAPAVFEGRLPEPEDFLHGAILMVGMKGAHVAAGRLAEIYAKTGKTPIEVMADAKKDPSIIEDLAPGDFSSADAAHEIPRAYRPMASEQAAIDAFPGVKAEQVLDRPFADIPETKLPHQLNTKYIDGPDSLRALQSRMSEVYQTEIDSARGGTRSWAETEAMASRQIADLTGQGLDQVRMGRQIGDGANDVQLKVMGDMLMQATVDAGLAIKRVKEAGNSVSDAMKLEALEAIHRSAMIQADFTGASAEVGRALAYLKRVKEIRAQGEGIQKLVESYGYDPAKMLEMAAELDNPTALAKFAREVTQPNTEQKILEAWKAGLVSGPVTQVANVMGNTTYMALRPLVDLAASGFGFASRASERVHATEAFARVFGDLHGIMDGLKLAKVAIMEDTAGGKAGSREAISGTKGYIIRTPFRALSAMDQVFRTMTERGEAYALGARQAAAEGFNPATREFRERVAEIANNPTEAQIEEIQAFGARGTFNAELGEKGQAINNAIVKAHLEFAVPFRGTPANVYKEMVRLTPAAPFIGEWRADIAAGGVRAQKAVAEMAIGTGLSALTMTLASAGHISGSGDPDPNKRRVKAAAGWQPYSIKVGDTWYSYQRFQPVGTLVGLAADVSEAREHMTPGESDKAIKILGTAFANAVTHQTFLQGIATLTDAISQPDRKMGRFIQNLAGSAVPALVNQTAQTIDPYKREVDGILAAVQSRIPGLREQLPPQRDPYGEPIPGDDRIGWISPITTKDVSADKVRTEAARLGVSAPRTPKALQLPAAGIKGKLGQVPLTPEQQDVFGDVAGHLAYQVLEQMVNRPGWDDMPDLVKEKAYTTVFEKTRRVGKAVALSPEQRQKEIQRIVGAVQEKLKR